MVNTKAAVILLVGSERYLKEKAINDLRLSILDSSSGELDYKVLHGVDTSADEILASVSVIPFFSSKRLVVVKSFEKLSKEDTTRLVNYIKNPNQYTCLVIDTMDGDILKDDPSLASYVKVLKFSEPTDNEVSSWISKFVYSRNKSIEEEAIEILKELKGYDLLNLSQELEKLITYTGTRKKITVSDVEDLVGKSVMASAFDIAHAAAEMDTSKAVSIVYDLVSSGKKPYEIIGLLAWHFKTLLKINYLLSESRTEYSIMQDLRFPRKSAQAFFTQAALYSSEEIGSKLQILLEADLSIKRARYSPSLILEFAIIRLCLVG
jgi:DNA polymerase-3 subunit delta